MTVAVTPVVVDRQLIIDTIWLTYVQAVPEETEPPDGDREATRLFGQGASLDSLGLVVLLLDVEQQINDRFDTLISLMDERAMSQTKSPFRSIGTLADYVEALISEDHG